ncbi:putative Esterase [Heracleum sosnowskyi]|uniref:Esterase n=1 Tax=Heracleum sosnowskyi TaxID=360622 RepID=A0AAD8H4G3_9APIA|nr:putative Esterase [Heracleum sosnowskyi]
MYASSKKMSFLRILFVFILIVRVKSTGTNSQDCNIPAIYNFGDSNSDTGGISAALSPADPPTGETYFGIPTGRASDGRLIIDFIADSLGLPYLSAYLNSIKANFEYGANFATGGATIRRQNESWFQNGVSPFSLDVQVQQFDQFKTRTTYFYNQAKNESDRSTLPSPDDFSNALYVIDIGQNDLGACFRSLTNPQCIATFPDIVEEFATAVKKLYYKGARAFWIHNTGPFGCLPIAATNHPNPEPGYFDEFGCRVDQNDIAIEFNKQLKERVIQLRTELPYAALTHVDMFAAKHQLIKDANNQGFEDALSICCGYHQDGVDIWCGNKEVVNGTLISADSCPNPSKLISWDAVHYTEAANDWIANHIVDGSFSDPPVALSQACRKSISI